MKVNLKKILHGAANIVYPPRCAFCGEFCSDTGFCGKCELPLAAKHDCNAARARAPALNGFCAPFFYTGGAKKAVLDLKENHAGDNAAALAGFMADLVSGMRPAEGFDIVSYVPSSPKSRRERGYNQSELLAGHISGAHSLPCAGLLVCKKKASDQKELNARDRRRNIAGAFAFNEKTVYSVNGRTVLLVDDVFTTGSTLNETASILKQAGAASVWGVCAALTALKNDT